jgi:hypothetical protein
VRALTGSALLLSTLLEGRPVCAQQEGVAESLFRQAREDMKRGEPQRACPKLEESYRLDPSLGTLLNLGLCEQQIDRIATAWSKLHQFIEEAPTDDVRLPLAREKLAELERDLPKIRLDVSAKAERGTVSLDGIELHDASLSVDLPVDPGEHVITLRMPTGETTRNIVQVARGKLVVVSLSPSEASPAPELVHGPLAEPPHAPPPALSSARTLGPSEHKAERAAAYVFGAAGVAGLAVGGVFGALALKNKQLVREHCPDHTCTDQTGVDAVGAGSRDEVIATLSVAVGLSSLAAGAILWWRSGRGIALSTGSNSASLSLVGDIP